MKKKMFCHAENSPSPSAETGMAVKRSWETEKKKNNTHTHTTEPGWELQQLRSSAPRPAHTIPHAPTFDSLLKRYESNSKRPAPVSH